MDETDRPVSGNVSLFVDMLRWESRPAHQDGLKRLLIQEEDRFGAREERWALIERILQDGAEHIVRQTRLIAKMKGDGADTASAERLLETFQMIQFLFEKFRVDTCEAQERAARAWQLG